MNRIATTTALIVTVLLAATACSSTDIHTPSRAHPQQKYALGAVRQRVKELQPGMSRMEVMIRLGSPATQKTSTWIYKPEDEGLGIIPREVLIVSFQGNAYVSHRMGTP